MLKGDSAPRVREVLEGIEARLGGAAASAVAAAAQGMGALKFCQASLPDTGQVHTIVQLAAASIVTLALMQAGVTQADIVAVMKAGDGDAEDILKNLGAS